MAAGDGKNSRVFMAKKRHFRWDNEILMELACPSWRLPALSIKYQGIVSESYT